MTSGCTSVGAVMTGEVLQIPCKQSVNSAEEYLDEIYESSLGTWLGASRIYTAYAMGLALVGWGWD